MPSLGAKTSFLPCWNLVPSLALRPVNPANMGLRAVYPDIMNNSILWIILCWKSVLGTIIWMSVVCSHTRFQIPHFFLILGSAATLGKWVWREKNGSPQSHMQTSVIFLNKTGPIAHHGYLSIYYSATAKVLLCQSKYDNLLKENLQTQAGHLSQTAYISQRQIPK
jgi:hypothetical protein